MHKQQRDAVIQVLEKALNNLRDDTSDGDVSSELVALIGDRLSSETRNSEAPIILLIAGDLKSRSHANLGHPKEAETVNAGPSNHSERKVSHPGLERFTIVEAGSHSSVPRACFMEPTRVCVKSGACEMRGF